MLLLLASKLKRKIRGKREEREENFWHHPWERAEVFDLRRRKKESRGRRRNNWEGFILGRPRNWQNRKKRAARAKNLKGGRPRNKLQRQGETTTLILRGKIRGGRDISSCKWRGEKRRPGRRKLKIRPGGLEDRRNAHHPRP